MPLCVSQQQLLLVARAHGACTREKKSLYYCSGLVGGFRFTSRAAACFFILNAFSYRSAAYILSLIFSSFMQTCPLRPILFFDHQSFRRIRQCSFSPSSFLYYHIFATLLLLFLVPDHWACFFVTASSHHLRPLSLNFAWPLLWLDARVRGHLFLRAFQFGFYVHFFSSYLLDKKVRGMTFHDFIRGLPLRSICLRIIIAILEMLLLMCGKRNGNIVNGGGLVTFVQPDLSSRSYLFVAKKKCNIRSALPFCWRISSEAVTFWLITSFPTRASMANEASSC